MGILKLFIVIALLNQWLFEKDLAREFQEDQTPDKSATDERKPVINESIEDSFIDEEKQTPFSENRAKNYRDLFSYQNFAEMYKKQRELVTVVSQQQEAIERMQESNNMMHEKNDRMQEKNDKMQQTNDRVLAANNTMQQTIVSMKKEMDRLKDMIESKDSLK
jgi:hypothetical protein